MTWPLKPGSGPRILKECPGDGETLVQLERLSRAIPARLETPAGKCLGSCQARDGGSYESRIQALGCLYDKLSIGGYVIVDDQGNVAGCRQAVHVFRTSRQIRDAIRPID